ncbi:hypothetical protein ACFOM8_15750 [Paracoccus angustae]|uniref:DUF3035 domain-containing protein n=1 Tax=Paracoccus angustae TaxID=1671480 RepID=A0ABV7U733_9RHOB
MRGCLILSVLALAGCGEHLGWNPNYNFGPTRYGQYRAAREAALVTDAESPKTIPVARPFYAPTGAEIAGRSPVPIPPTMGVDRVRVVRKVQTVPARPVAVQGVLVRDRNAPVVIVPPSMRAGDQPPL